MKCGQDGNIKKKKKNILGEGNKVSVNILSGSIDQSDETKATR